MKRRVVITGLGVLSSMGIGVEKFWESIKEGRSGISIIERFDTSKLNVKVAGEIKNYVASDFLDKKEAKRMDRFTQYAVIASKLAVENAKLDLEKVEKTKFGVIIGSGIGGIETFEEQYKILLEKGPNRVSPFFIPMMIANIASGQVAIELGAKGFNECVVTACASSTNALGDALRVIQRGECDIIVAGGTEAPIVCSAVAGFSSMKALSTNPDPNSATRPFDKERDGFVMAEGAASLVVEELEHALSRGANIIAELVGYGCTDDAYHITAPATDGEGGARCMQKAVDDAGISTSDVDYINAHGTSTPYNDKFETKAIKTVFGEHAYKLAVSSTKSMTGHLLGAAGAIEAIVTCLAVKNDFLPPTINYKNPDEECDLDYVVNVGRNSKVNYALSNSLGFGGHNASVLFKKFN